MKFKCSLYLSLLVVFSISLAPPSLGQSDDECKKKPFTYDNGPLGQPHWCGFCNEPGRTRQAPINIQTKNAKPVASLPELKFAGYKATKLVPYRKYHNLKVDYSGGESFIKIGETDFKLAEFHFHRPSEETLNGIHTAMVIHLVHDKADPKGPTPVIAILVRAGQPRENTKKLVDALIQNAPVVNGRVAPEDVEINAADLLPPADNKGLYGYYRYEGSLTTPACEEGVTFYVLKTPVTFSLQQLEEFKKRYPFANARKIQTGNTSPVEKTTY